MTCQAVKRYFDSLKQEYAALQAENKKRYPEYKQEREKMIELLTAKNNVERIWGATEKEKNRDHYQLLQKGLTSVQPNEKRRL